jgi:hypothetical protein
MTRESQLGKDPHYLLERRVGVKGKEEGREGERKKGEGKMGSKLR